MERRALALPRTDGLPRNLLLLSFLQETGLHLLRDFWEFQKNIYFCFIDYAKAFDCVNHNKQNS